MRSERRTSSSGHQVTLAIDLLASDHMLWVAWGDDVTRYDPRSREQIDLGVMSVALATDGRAVFGLLPTGETSAASRRTRRLLRRLSVHGDRRRISRRRSPRDPVRAKAEDLG